jgi:hypothetical protein
MTLGAAKLADALPIAIVARDERGRVAFVNAAARKALKLGDIAAADMSLTLIRRGESSSENANVYLLSAEHEALARIVAEPTALPLDERPDLEILTLASPGRDDAAPTRDGEATKPTNPPAQKAKRRIYTASPETTFHPRQLLACAGRRIRRHFRNDVDLLVAAAPTKRCDRRVRLDEIAFAEVLLSSATWVRSRSSANTLELGATIAGHRLKIALEGQPAFGQPALDVEREWLRTARPFIDSHRATIELHDDSERCGIVIAVPLLR